MDDQKVILIAEPEEGLSEKLRAFFRDRGFILLKTPNLKETLLTLQEKRVDVLVLDATLLEKDYGFICVIKGIEPELPVIVCAENNTPEIESQIRKQKIFYYHIKPFGIQDLEMAISNAVNGLSH
ncbi:MAG: response regulator [Deltaproteobacteria bacterium]|nr:response regulator [Deltaproteobacteria bacterium]MBW2047294.1 response regulator [Deltaproteobacteria bacterium]MBW2110036.1 response regulator [Deltaproteobacteria bacterium]MBW2353321.1 response regulator [Deltaproteobacteria bacterium]HDZ90387.1 response regulator [Deltaproteobacteria bacterium]